MRNSLISLGLILASPVHFSGMARADELPPPAAFPHERHGENTLVLDFPGAALWVTERDPQANFAPLHVGLTYGHRIDVARVGSRLGFLLNPLNADAPLVFLMGDLVSIERVYRETSAFRPYWRVALGFVLDLRGPERDLGDEGYFNDDNGAAGGLSLGHGWGFDAFVSERMFLRAELEGRVHGGAGRVGVLFGAHGGVGWVL